MAVPRGVADKLLCNFCRGKLAREVLSVMLAVDGLAGKCIQRARRIRAGVPSGYRRQRPLHPVGLQLIQKRHRLTRTAGHLRETLMAPIRDGSPELFDTR